MGFTRTFQYNYTLGYVTTSTDLNPGNTTTYKYGTQPTNCSYQDELNRLTEVDSPDGGVTTNCYNDAAATSTTSKLLDSSTSTWETNLSIRDGMTHTTRTQLTTDPDPSGYATVDMSYDGEGTAVHEI